MPDLARNQSFRPVLQFSRLPGAQHPAQDQADVECAEMNPQALEMTLPSLKCAASHSAASASSCHTRVAPVDDFDRQPAVLPVFIERNAQKEPQAQRVLPSPADASLGIEPCAQRLDECVQFLAVKHFVETNIEPMTWPHIHIRIRHPQILLPLPVLARPRRQDSFLRTRPVDTHKLVPPGIRTFASDC
jgi:hypothetical protein